jgi:hypothetical protein
MFLGEDGVGFLSILVLGLFMGSCHFFSLFASSQIHVFFKVYVRQAFGV